jgi:hypothetical protein
MTAQAIQCSKHGSLGGTSFTQWVDTTVQKAHNWARPPTGDSRCSCIALLRLCWVLLGETCPVEYCMCICCRHSTCGQT